MVKFKLQWILFLILLHLINCYCHGSDEFSAFEADKAHGLDVSQVVSDKRYLIYGVNPGEGFNLRRDIEQNALPWRRFFDMKSLNRYVPVVDFEEFLNETGGPRIEETVYLQRYKEGWKDGKWEEKIDERDCIEEPIYKKDENGVYHGYFWGLSSVFSEKFRCMSVQGLANVLIPFLMESKARLVK